MRSHKKDSVKTTNMDRQVREKKAENGEKVHKDLKEKRKDGRLKDWRKNSSCLQLQEGRAVVLKQGNSFKAAPMVFHD